VLADLTSLPSRPVGQGQTGRKFFNDFSRARVHMRKGLWGAAQSLGSSGARPARIRATGVPRRQPQLPGCDALLELSPTKFKNFSRAGRSLRAIADNASLSLQLGAW